MATYKVGDKVRVRTDLNVGNKYGLMIYVESMHETVMEQNGVVTIKEIYSNDKPFLYYIEGYEQPWFTDEMFEGLVEEEKPTEPTEPTTINVNININVDPYHNACWYCRKGGIVDRLFDGMPGICPFCGRVVNMPNVMVVKHSEPIAPKTEETNHTTFNVGDRVIWRGHKGTVICIAYDNDLGIEFDEDDIGIHGCGGIKLKAGEPSKSSKCLWCKPNACKHIDEPKPTTPTENKPLTAKELYELPIGTKVFTVWRHGEDTYDWDDERTRWRTLIERKHSDGDRGLKWLNDESWVEVCRDDAKNNSWFHAYLHEPKRPTKED